MRTATCSILLGLLCVTAGCNGTKNVKNADNQKAYQISQPFEVYAECYAPHRWTWSWELNIGGTGDGRVHVIPDEYGEELDVSYTWKEEEIAKLLQALNKANVWDLAEEYGDPQEPIRRTLIIKAGDREKTVIFTSRHSSLDAVPDNLLELWIVVRDLFEENRDHDGREYIRQYLETKDEDY